MRNGRTLSMAMADAMDQHNIDAWERWRTLCADIATASATDRVIARLESVMAQYGRAA